MPDPVVVRGGVVDAPAAPVAAGHEPTRPTRADLVRTGVALLLLATLLGAAYVVHGLEVAPGGSVAADAAVLLLVGAALGIAFERGRFCFFCISRDFAERRDADGLRSILTALAVGAIGYAAVLSLFVPDPTAGRLPPEAHIGPVTPVLALGGFVFGIGMVLSHGCIAGHLYRITQGAVRSGVALVGTLVGFGLGFWTWNRLYLGLIGNRAPETWLPTSLGYGGALLATLAVLALVAALLGRWPSRSTTPPRATGVVGTWRRLVVDRWPPLLTGVVVGLVGVASYLLVGPLGVTAQLGSVTRSVLDAEGALPGTLHGLDAFAGCATVVAGAVIDNGWLVIGLVVGAFAAALAGGRVRLERVGATGAVAALVGGVLLGWGAMTALGCTVGVLLSGTQAFALSGWVFAAAFVLGAALAFRFRLQDL
ncbi:putative membrane protein YedE/YeeE [Nocardioides zeae]|uniref:Membrane protein YedE/YeeE n=1 Tax=Nocardioides zeae TaxID=1457234 RepID=A0ACC6IIQ0_9ACTN|nr:YeeE/YedE family protein [Nocardioides zeae]MDR6174463.1 putative membrane protein YedE/YeeE [Nocardioides zeae]MDR6210535.1 putative membrane protein YedE/YeeE [Nocardioides zeae]